MSSRSERWAGVRIFAIRAEKGTAFRELSRADLLRLLNPMLPKDHRLTEPRLRRMELDVSEPPVVVMRALAELADVPFEDFALRWEPSKEVLERWARVKAETPPGGEAPAENRIKKGPRGPSVGQGSRAKRRKA